jgi:hypothetical protein
MVKRKTKEYYKEQASKYARSARKQKELKDATIEGIKEGIRIAKEARD